MHAFLLLAGLLCGGADARTSGAAAAVQVSAESELEAAQHKLDLALKALDQASEPGAKPEAKQAAESEVRLRLAAVERAKARLQAGVKRKFKSSGTASKGGGARAQKRVVQVERFDEGLRGASGEVDASALASGFDAARRSGGFTEPSASGPSYSSFGGVDVGRLGLSLQPPVTSDATQKVLVGLSSRRKAAAQKAIPHIDRYGESLGIYNLLRAAGIREPRVFVLSIMRRESAFDPWAEGTVGERGLMQVRPETAQPFIGKKSLFVIQNNVQAGMGYLKEMLVRFGRPDHALFAYNAGPTRTKDTLEEKGRLPKIETSHKYVKTILGFYSQALGIRRPDFTDTFLARGSDGDAPSRSVRRVPAGK